MKTDIKIEASKLILEIKDKKLILADAKYKTVIDTLFEGVLMINADERIGACNSRATEILGRRA